MLREEIILIIKETMLHVIPLNGDIKMKTSMFSSTFHILNIWVPAWYLPVSPHPTVTTDVWGFLGYRQKRQTHQVTDVVSSMAQISQITCCYQQKWGTVTQCQRLWRPSHSWDVKYTALAQGLTCKIWIVVGGRMKVNWLGGQNGSLKQGFFLITFDFKM